MGKIKEDFLSVRSAITLGAFILAYVLIYQGKLEVQFLERIIDLLLGFWFGNKVASAIKKTEV